MQLADFRSGLDAWIDDNVDELTPHHGSDVTFEQELNHLAKVKRMTFDAGWMRYGWPEWVGGLGGTNLLRAYLGEALTLRDLVEPSVYSMTEVLTPSVLNFAPRELAAETVPRFLRGDEVWCQGFSEPDTGSNLGSLTCRALRVSDDWRVFGQKVWTSLAQYAQRCILLTRTGAPESGRRGITALFVDMDTPGITVRPIGAMHGRDEFCEVFFDDVRVPIARTLGEIDGGWAVAMDLLPYERSTALWHRVAYLRQRLQVLLDSAREHQLDPVALGTVVQQTFAFHARSLQTQHRLAGGGRLGPETSVDKALLGLTDQAVFDIAADIALDDIALGDDARSTRWRRDFLYSRAATIYGGSIEIQRNVIANRVLDLGREP